MLRWEGVEAGQVLPGPPLLFLNTHPRELVEPGLVASLRALREHHPRQPLTLEIHESAVTDAAMMAELRPALTELNVALAYDDFGAGQSRLNELVEASPDYVKFDISLVHEIESASAARQQLVATLVKMVRDLGIAAVAEGVETAAENECCRQLDFDLGQGYLYGRPAPAKAFQKPA